MLNKIQYFIIGRFAEGSKYGVISKRAVEGYKIDEVAAVRKVDGRQGAFWVVDSFQTGIAIVATGCKTRKAAVENYENNWKKRVAAVLTEDRLKKYMEDLHAAPAEEELAAYQEIDIVTTYGYRYDKYYKAAKNAGCIIRDVKEESYISGGHIKVYGTAAMLEELVSLIEHYKKYDAGKTEEEKAAFPADPVQDNTPEEETTTPEETTPAADPEPEKVERKEVENMEEQRTETTPEKEIDVSKLTAENIADYLPALLMSLANDKHNSSIILAAGIQAGVIPPAALLEYFQFGRMPAVHTFDIWKKAGYTVKKGEKAAFTARIWKFTEKDITLTAEDAAAMNAANVIDGIHYAAGDTISRGDFIKKVAFFFTAAQVEKTPELQPLPDLPEDVKKETRGGCEWISGNTRPIKESLKAAGFRWSKKNSAWYRREAA